MFIEPPWNILNMFIFSNDFLISKYIALFFEKQYLLSVAFLLFKCEVIR